MQYWSIRPKTPKLEEIEEPQCQGSVYRFCPPCCEMYPHTLAEPETNEQVAVRASDLRGLMGDWYEFKQNSENLRKEMEELNGSQPDYEAWVEGVLDTLTHYASQDLELTPEHETEDGLSEFHAQLGRNIGQFIHEYVEEDMEIDIAVSY